MNPAWGVEHGARRALRVAAALTFLCLVLVPRVVLALVSATGGNSTNDITTNGITYRVHTFTNSATASNFVVTAGGEVEYLVVGGGGGGGGGYEGGGGGAGGYLSGSTVVIAKAYSITVGAGGNGCVGADPGPPYIDGDVATDGSNSVFDTFTAVGGGRGGSELPDATPNIGGSGGGGTWDGDTAQSGAAGTAGPPIQGYAGGNAVVDPPYGANNIGGGGGGGSSGAGTNGVTDVTQAPGGPGTANSISGSSVTYAAGGKGALKSRNANGANAAANTGNGGEAGGNSAGGSTGGNGGSGIVIIRYVWRAGTLLIVR